MEASAENVIFNMSDVNIMYKKKKQGRIHLHFSRTESKLMNTRDDHRDILKQ